MSFLRLWHWVDERLPLSTMFRLGTSEAMPGGSSFAYTLGSATLMVFLLQVVTGIWQLFYYVPTVDHAYDSLNYLRQDVSFGWLISGLHYWGGSAMVVLIGLHMLRVFIWGAYKRPREMTWLLGVVLLLITVGMSFTGIVLPWDQKGYWAGEVGTSMAATIPLIGNLLEGLLRGGHSVGQLTLSRFFVQHVAILPVLATLVVVLHLIAVRQFGSAGPWSETKHRSGDQFWPDQVFKDALVGTVLLLLLVALAAYVPPPLAGSADPLDASYRPKPEWNFLFLYEALKSFSGRFELLGTAGIPALIVLLFVLLPFLDRYKERKPSRRLFVMICGGVFVATLLGLTITGYYSQPGSGETPSTAMAPPVNSSATLSASARKGAGIFESMGCRACHKIDGTGGAVGPDLSNEALKGRSRDWLAAQIRNPKVHDPQSAMPSFRTLSTGQIDNLVDYLESLGSDKTAAKAVRKPNHPGIPPNRFFVGTAAVFGLILLISGLMWRTIVQRA